MVVQLLRLMPFVLLFSTQSARAICLRGGTVELARLADMVGDDPQKAVEQATQKLSSARTLRLSPDEIAWLYAIQANSYDNLSLPEQARSAALTGMKVIPDLHHPAHVELLTEYAYNGFDTAQIDQSIPLVERAWAAQPPGSAAAICLQATLGHLQRMRDRPDLAVVNMMQAYRASLRPGLEEQRVFVATAFSILMRYASDWKQALALNQESIDWAIAKHRRHDLADSRFKGGWILGRQGLNEQALEQFRLARELRKPFHDVVNDAYIDLQTCEVLVNMGRFGPARTACLSAEHIFAAHGDASRGQAHILLARIALGQNRPRAALASLDTLLRDGDTNSASVNTARLYRYRSKALAALGRHAEAYADLNRYVERNARWSQTEGAKQAAILRARFETDRQIDKNRTLRAELGLASEREREQRRGTMIVLVFGGIFILLLGYIVLAGRSHRRRLQRLANSDGLTGLLSRRRTTDRGGAILEQSLRVQDAVSVAIIDLDHFKSVNDTYGHAAGDEVLRQFADAGRQIKRHTDVLGRWGGEEFLLIMPQTTATDAFEIVERLRTLAMSIRLPFSNDLRIDFSAGVASLAGERTLDELVANADLALYSAKANGRSATCVYSDALSAGPETQDPAPSAPRTDELVHQL